MYYTCLQSYSNAVVENEKEKMFVFEPQVEEFWAVDIRLHSFFLCFRFA
jgi:hypothetical protein